MAGPRRGNLSKKKKPVVRVTQKAKEQFKALKAAHGEPTYTDKEMTNLELRYAFNWYNMTYGPADAKAYIITYLKNTGRDTELRKLKEVPDKWTTTTAGWIARIRSMGGNVPESIKRSFETMLSDILSRDYNTAGKIQSSDGEGPLPPKVPAQKVSKTKENPWHEAICHIEEQIDKLHTNGYKSSFNPKEYLQSISANPAICKAVFDFYDPKLNEIEAAYEKTDKSIVEGYAGYKRAQLEALYDLYVAIVEDADELTKVVVEKKPRKPRTPKPISVEKKMEHFNFMQSDVVNNIKSIPDASKILGAAELWMFNTKYNQLTVHRMKDGKGLDIYRTAITNFDETLSKTKKLKAKDVSTVLNQVLTGGKIVLRKAMDDIRGSDQKLQERVNENTILLRVVPK